MAKTCTKSKMTLGAKMSQTRRCLRCKSQLHIEHSTNTVDSALDTQTHFVRLCLVASTKYRTPNTSISALRDSRAITKMGNSRKANKWPLNWCSTVSNSARTKWYEKPPTYAALTDICENVHRWPVTKNR